MEVTISDGDIIGQSEITSKNTSYYSFKGIPFAEPPVGPLRFAVSFQINCVLKSKENFRVLNRFLHGVTH